MQFVVAFASGIIFGLGLTISEMINPARVIGFLDITGRWDPRLFSSWAAHSPFHCLLVISFSGAPGRCLIVNFFCRQSATSIGRLFLARQFLASAGASAAFAQVRPWLQ
jgi:uncharacterized membrane protein YedE/YeeE